MVGRGGQPGHPHLVQPDIARAPAAILVFPILMADLYPPAHPADVSDERARGARVSPLLPDLGVILPRDGGSKLVPGPDAVFDDDRIVSIVRRPGMWPGSFTTANDATKEAK